MDCQIEDQEYGLGHVSSVRVRDDGNPLVSIDFDEPADFNGDSFLETEVSVWVPATNSERIKRAYQDARRQIDSKKQAEKARALATRRREEKVIEESFGGLSLWHMTHMSNLPSILGRGLLSHSCVHSEQIRYHDISEESVQHWREGKETVYSQPIHGYVPLYINPRNAMLYKRRSVQHELCVIEIAKSIILDKKCVVSDGNAAAQRTKFFCPIDGLTKLDWKTLRKGTWYDDKEAKRRMCAEVLVPNEIAPEYFDSIRCIDAKFLRHIKASSIRSIVSPELYF